MKIIKKGILLLTLLAGIAGFLFASDAELSYELNDYLLGLSGPGAPEILQDMVIFTAPSSLRRVGIAFAGEDFSRVHWFRQLLVRGDIQDIPSGTRNPSPYRDSGIVFYIYPIPEGTTTIDYRLVIDGLWTTDPANPHTRWDAITGLSLSTIAIPHRERVHHPLNGPPGSLSFTFRGPPGETVSVGGSFNGWDPFMYILKEGPPGNYTIDIPLPPGRYQYVFFHRGQRFLDPYNASRSYSRDGSAASEIIIH